MKNFIKQTYKQILVILFGGALLAGASALTPPTYVTDFTDGTMIPTDIQVQPIKRIKKASLFNGMQLVKTYIKTSYLNGTIPQFDLSVTSIKEINQALIDLINDNDLKIGKVDKNFMRAIRKVAKIKQPIQYEIK